MDNLSSAATNIVRNSILSSIYVDDKIVEPFDEVSGDKGKYYEISKRLYLSFRKEKKVIDFYKYEKGKDWKDDSEYLFKNRDLLILDWQLNDEQRLKQSESLKILGKAVQTDNLHFVSIYTETPVNQLPEIFYSIKAFFNSTFNAVNRGKCENIIEQLDNEGIDTTFFDKYREQFFQLALEREESKREALVTIKEGIQAELGDKYRIFAKGIREISSNINNSCEVFGYLINNEPFFEGEEIEAEVKTDFISEGFIVVNHTIIQVTNKSEPKPEDLFYFFTDAVRKVCGNLLTLISLEVRTLLRESSGFIGKDADKIKDAILYHQFDKKSGFLDFLMGIIKSHTMSHFDYKQGKLESAKEEFWKKYDEEKGIKYLVEDLAKAENEQTLVEEILKLNVYYNILHITRSEKEVLKFGDIFYRQKDGSYFLCITAHCDCLYPKPNIKSNFYFIVGKKEDPKDLIKSGDDVFCSYLKDQEKIIAVKWNQRPTILKVLINEIVNDKLIGIDGLDEKYELHYHSTVKENYAQRMANNSFAHAMRVGIDFASI